MNTGDWKMTLVRMRLARSEGFTLIELLVVIVLIGILAGVATPSLRAWKQNADLSADFRRLYGVFQRTRVEAVKTNANAALVFDQAVSGKTFDCVVFADPNANRVFDAGEEVVVSVDFNSSVTISANSFAANAAGLKAVGFNGRGLPLGGGAITLLGGINTGTTHTLIMDPITGRIRTQ